MNHKFLTQKLVEELYATAKHQFMFKSGKYFYYLATHQKLYCSPIEMLANNETTGTSDLIGFNEIDEIFVDGQKVFEKEKEMSR